MSSGSRWRPRWPAVTRDTTLFLVGLAGIVNEAFIRAAPTRPELLVLFAGMVGLPVALRRDARPGPPSSDDGSEPTG